MPVTPLRCNETRAKKPKPGGQDAFMVIGLDYVSPDIHSGDKIYIK